MTTKTKTNSNTVHITTPEFDTIAVELHQLKAQLDAVKAEYDARAETLRKAAEMARSIQGGGKTFAFGPADEVVEVTHREGASYLPAKDFVTYIFVLGLALLNSFIPGGRISVNQEQIDGFAAVQFKSPRKQAAQQKVLAAIKRAAESWAVKVVA